jgi:hypothetical protein
MKLIKFASAPTAVVVMIQHFFLGCIHGTVLHGFHLRFAGHLISCFSQIPYDRLNIATDITDLGKFSCFDFNERPILMPRKLK